MAADTKRRLIALRHDLHREPELSMREFNTAGRLEAELRDLSPKSIRRVAGTGVVARLSGRYADAPVVAIRGDIDALPIHEDTGVEYASTTEHVMHACGHDVHAAWTVGAACLLVDNPAEGDVLVLLQPGEETAEGARAVLEGGVLEDVAAVIGAHVDMRYPVGTIVAAAGHMAASADEFVIDLHGSGAHAARPHEGVNPITGGAQLVSALHSVVAQTIPAGTPAVVTVARFVAGSASNVIPSEAVITGTVRTVSAADRAKLHGEIVRVAEHVAEAYGLGVHVEFVAGTPPLVNSAAAAGWVQEAVRTVLGEGALVPLAAPNLGGEDFAFYLERLPGSFFRVGGRAPNQDAVPAHSSRFLPADEAIPVGAAVLAESVRVASEKLAAERR